MKKYYELKGMTCDGCVDNVRNALMELPDVTNADVKLQPQGVLLTMSEPIDTRVLQNQINKAGHYTILNSYGDGDGIDDPTPEVERNESFSHAHPEPRTKPFGIDHEPGVS